MTVRPPRMYADRERDNALGYEIAQEQAAALGRLGRALEAALAALSQHDGLQSRCGDRREPIAASAVRARLLQEAGNALWCFVVQREACGLRDQTAVMRDYRVPADVQNRMGVFGTASPLPTD